MSHDVNLGYILGKINNVNSAELKGDEIIQSNTSSSTINITSTPLDDHIANNVENPHELTKEQVGLSNVENKSPNEILNNISNKVVSIAVGFDVNDTIFSNRVFGFELDSNEAEPSRAIRYIGKNYNYKPAHMDYTNNVFDYGDWTDAWFIKDIKVVLMRFDGTIECELNPNDYTKDIAGNTIDITSANKIGNVMIGIPTVWIKYDTRNMYKSRFYFSPVKLDDSYKAYAHTNHNGEILEYKWLAAYECWIDDVDRLRSVSNVVMPTTGNYCDKTIQQQRYSAKNNYRDNDKKYDISSWSDRMLICLLLLLIGRNTDTQEVFGHGNERGYSENKNSAKGSPWNSNSYGILNTGTMNTKGLFWGANDTGSNHSDYKGVKVFGIEHWWGNNQKWALGWNRVDSTDVGFMVTYVKMTPEFHNGIDYLPLPSNSNIADDDQYNIDIYNLLDDSDNGYESFYGFEDIESDNSFADTGIQWIGWKYGLTPYSWPDQGNDKYFPDYVYIPYDDGQIYTRMALCGGISNYMSICGAFCLSSNSIGGNGDWASSSFLCSF